MRKVFIGSWQSHATVRRHFRRYYPWVTIVARAYGGYWGFESRNDYLLWRRQK